MSAIQGHTSDTNLGLRRGTARLWTWKNLVSLTGASGFPGRPSMLSAGVTQREFRGNDPKTSIEGLGQGPGLLRCGSSSKLNVDGVGQATPLPRPPSRDHGDVLGCLVTTGLPVPSSIANQVNVGGHGAQTALDQETGQVTPQDGWQSMATGGNAAG